MILFAEFREEFLFAMQIMDHASAAASWLVGNGSFNNSQNRYSSARI